MYTDTKETTRQVNGQTICCGSRLYINIFWKQLFHLSISTFQQQKLNDETVTLPNLRILSMPIKKKKTILCKTPSYKNRKNTYWILILIFFFCFYSPFFCWKKCDIRSHPSCNKTSHSWSVNGNKNMETVSALQ